MMIRGIRGATTVEQDTEQEILEKHSSCLKKSLNKMDASRKTLYRSCYPPRLISIPYFRQKRSAAFPGGSTSR